jgi:LmbE family N-acetylglucosaminyl deacetylase
MPRDGRTLLAVVAHPDDEVGAAGALLAQRARGDQVHIAWLTDGESTGALGDRPDREVASIRREHAREAAGILGAEPHFFGWPDSRLRASPERAGEVARLLAEVRPDGLVTFGRAWIRGLRHPDHRETGRIARDAVTLARLGKVVDPLDPHRAPCPVFTYRGAHSRLPAVAVDVEPHLETIYRLGEFYQERVGFGDPDWIERRLRAAAEGWDARYVELYDAWETEPGLVESLLPARRAGPPHPDDGG